MKKTLMLLLSLAVLTAGCAPRLSLFGNVADPLVEYTLRGKADEKVLVIPIRGMISDKPDEKFYGDRPSMLQEVVSQLQKAEKDDKVKAIVLKIESMGGTVTASDILYNEIMRLKEKKGVKVVAVFMNVAASGGYYIALPADKIVAHPTTVTGSVGVIFMRPDLSGLMDKLGLGVKVNKSGKYKDIGSLFRPGTPEEDKIIQEVVDQLAKRFSDLLEKHRNLDPKALSEVLTARVYLASEAKNLGLVDRIGYLDDTLFEAKSIAGLPDDARVVVYRRSEYADDNLYNSSTMKGGGEGFSLVNLGLDKTGALLSPGFYYLWWPNGE